MNKKQLVIIATLVGVILSGVFSFILIQRKAELDRENAVLVSLPNFDLSQKGATLIKAMKDDSLTLEVAQYNDLPLMDQLIDTTLNRPEPELSQGNVPWFYYSPGVANRSPLSTVNVMRLVETLDFDDFAWYQSGDQQYLFQADAPYTGWFSTDFDGWHYFVDGIEQSQHRLTNAQVSKWLAQREVIQFLTPQPSHRQFYEKEPVRYLDLVENSDVYPQILYKNPNNIILTAPPGTAGSLLLTTTQDFVDMPMEVVREVKTNQGNWLEVQIGYDSLGWIKKDPTYTDYVRTYYSEQALLDVIEQVLWEEISSIGAVVGASFVNNETMSQVSANNQVFFPASTQKIYVIGEVYRQYAQGILSPTDIVTLWDEDKVPGAGIIQEAAAGSTYTVDELVNLVMIYSDNTAANLLIDTVGGAWAINPRVQQLGLWSTHIEGKYYKSEGAGFTTSPYDAARYFAYLYNNRLSGAPWDEEMINKFFMNTHNFLRQYIPSSTTAWNKSGLGGTEQNDVATFVTPYGTYSLAVYTAYPDNYSAISVQLGSLSLRVHDAFNEMRQSLWVTVSPEDY